MALDGLSGAGQGEGLGSVSGRDTGQIWKPRPLSFEPLPSTHIDDLDRHLRARVRLNALVAELCRKYRKEFPAQRYAASAKDSTREKCDLLRHYGGLPETVVNLNDVPTAILEEAVGAFATYFGLGSEAGGVPAGTRVGTAAELDPPPSRKEPEAAPW